MCRFWLFRFDFCWLGLDLIDFYVILLHLVSHGPGLWPELARSISFVILHQPQFSHLVVEELSLKSHGRSRLLNHHAS